MDPTWEEVVRRAQRRDAAAFARLSERHERAALAVAFGVLGDGNASGDAVQEAFVRAWERLADLKEPARFGPWLCGIVRNLAIDQLRRCRNEPRPGSDAPAVKELRHDARHPGQSYGDDPAEQMSRRERRDAIAAALDSLDEVSRSAVVLRYYDGLSSKQIGELLDLAPAAVDMRLTRARRVLRDRLDSTELAPGVGK